MRSISLAIILVLVILLVAVSRRADTKKRGQGIIYEMARTRAATTGKPLVVVGDPAAPNTLNSWFGAGYGCGDLCIDSNGAPSCPAGRRRRALLLDWLRAQPDDSAVIFESEVLMYVPRGELAETLDHLYRVSGGDLFSSHSNAIDVAAYAETGLRQAPRLFDLHRLRRTGASARVFLWYPPFDEGYGWVEFTDKAYDRQKAGS